MKLTTPSALMAKYFSKKDLYGGNIFDEKMTIDNETIMSSKPSKEFRGTEQHWFNFNIRSLSKISNGSSH
ncbi:hypothetical protein NC651_029422 [Populus alba x Populus x berolinensis]|nr:hypothetical protein NC651_029422 [Populus alba x Populus x berolinensis]